MENRDGLKDIAKVARKGAEEKADWKRNVGKLLEAYEQTYHIVKGN
jgi:hypothetical protein